MRLRKPEEIRQAGLFGFQQPAVQSQTVVLTYERHERCQVLLHRQELGAPLIQ